MLDLLEASARLSDQAHAAADAGQPQATVASSSSPTAVPTATAVVVLRARIVADPAPLLSGGGLPVVSVDGLRGCFVDLRRNPLGELEELTWCALALAGVVEPRTTSAGAPAAARAPSWPHCIENGPGGQTALELSAQFGWVPAIQRMLGRHKRQVVISGAAVGAS